MREHGREGVEARVSYLQVCKKGEQEVQPILVKEKARSDILRRCVVTSDHYFFEAFHAG